jgi:hypothetical protein
MISAARSSDGRQLGEGNTVPLIDRVSFPIEYRVSKLDGSRLGLPVNQNALQTVMRTWDGALSIVAGLRGVYVNRRGLENTPFNYAELLAFAKICTSLSACLLRRGKDPVPDGSIPVPVATIYKLVMGVHSTVDAMINNGEQWFDPDEVPTADIVYEYADSHQLFISRSNVACGGPKKKILQLLELLIRGNYESAPRQASTNEQVLSWREFEHAVDYGMKVVEMELAVRLFQAEIAKTFNDDKLKHMSGSEEQKELCAELRNAAAAGLHPDGANADYWMWKASILWGILERLGVRIARESVAAEDLEGAVNRYKAIVSKSRLFCNTKQNEIHRCLGVSESIDLSEKQVARRLNKNVHCIVNRRAEPRSTSG